MRKICLIAILLLIVMCPLFSKGSKEVPIEVPYSEEVEESENGVRISYQHDEVKEYISVKDGKVLITTDTVENRNILTKIVSEYWFAYKAEGDSDMEKAKKVYRLVCDHFLGEGDPRDEVLLAYKAYHVISDLEEAMDSLEGFPMEEEEPKIEETSPIEEEVNEEILEEPLPEVEEEISEEIPNEEEAASYSPSYPYFGYPMMMGYPMYYYPSPIKAEEDNTDYKNFISINSAVQLYSVNYFDMYHSLAPLETNFNSYISTFMGLSYRGVINDEIDVGFSTGLSLTMDDNELFLNTPILVNLRYKFRSMFAEYSIGGIMTYNENSYSMIPALGLSLGYSTPIGKTFLEVSTSITSGLWVFGNNASKSYILTEFVPVKISVVNAF